MHRKDFYFPSSDGKTKIHAVEWTPDSLTHIKGVIQIAHGLNEHITMYEPLARFFTDRCFVVRGNDHIGHGESIVPNEPYLYFGPNGSWHYASDDIYKLRSLTRKEYGETPYIIFGFSMGSYLVRDYLIRYNETIDAGIIVGCIYVNKVEHFFGSLIAKILEWLKGDRSKSALLEFIMNGTQNKQIKNAKTPFDWLNENEIEIEKIKRDPFAYGDITIGLFREMMYASQFTNKIENISKMNKDIPVLFISGKDDPVAKKGITAYKVAGLFKKAGVKNVHVKLYKGRHRVLFEEDQENTLIDIYDWACSKLNTECKNIEDLYKEFDKYIDEVDSGKILDVKKDHKEFFLTTFKTDKALLVTVEGSLTSITSPKLVGYCEGLKIDLKSRKLVIDLKNIDYIAPPGNEALQVLLDKYKDNITILR